jgi:hypothetical protein
MQIDNSSLFNISIYQIHKGTIAFVSDITSKKHPSGCFLLYLYQLKLFKYGNKLRHHGYRAKDFLTK